MVKLEATILEPCFSKVSDSMDQQHLPHQETCLLEMQNFTPDTLNQSAFFTRSLDDSIVQPNLRLSRL